MDHISITILPRQNASLQGTGDGSERFCGVSGVDRPLSSRNSGRPLGSVERGEALGVSGFDATAAFAVRPTISGTPHSTFCGSHSNRTLVYMQELLRAA